jgi:hypothetical protein
VEPREHAFSDVDSQPDPRANGTLAHQMGRSFAREGLADVHVEAAPIVLRDATALDNALGLRDWASLAHEQGLLDAHEVSTWENGLDAAAANGRFRYAFLLFITASRRRLPACATW